MLPTVILSTYNSPEHLRRSLWGYACQDTLAFDLVVAEDGAQQSNAEVIADVRAATGIELRHVTQEHRRFRKSRILNRAIHAASGDYLIFSDGDCVPRSDFVSQHVAAARRGRFLSGGIIRLSAAVTQQLAADHIRSGDFTEPGWLSRQGQRVSPKWKWLGDYSWLSLLFDQLTTTRPTFNGHNASAWKRDLLRVNGFDERMGYGGLDRELGERLENAGVRGLQIRHRTVCVHLDHTRNYVLAETLHHNRLIRETTRRKKLTWTSFGLCHQARESQPHERSLIPANLRAAA